MATVLAQALSVVFAVMLLIKKKKLPFKITKQDFCLNSQCKKFLKIGLPRWRFRISGPGFFPGALCFRQPSGTGGLLRCTGVACKIVNFAMLVPSALMQSMASFVSQNVGAGKTKRAKQSMFTGIGVGLSVGCLVFALIMLKGDMLTGFFSTETAVIQNGYDYLKVSLWRPL